MDITKATKSELLAEIKKREETEKQKLENQRRERDKFIYANIDAFLTLMPEHDRTSCSDKQPCNYGLNSHGYPSCIRCFLLECKQRREWENDPLLDIDLKISVEPRRDLFPVES